MPIIGWFEILLVVFIAIVVVGPKDFPILLKKTGSWISSIKRYIGSIQNEVAELDVDENQKSKSKIKEKSNDKI